MYNFLLVGHGGSHNRGSEAIIRTTVNLLNEEFSFPDIRIASIDFHNEKRINFGANVKIIPIFTPFKAKNNWNIFRLFLNVFRFFRNRIRYFYFISHFKNADAVLSIGGDNFTSGFLSMFLDFNDLAKKFHKKLIIWAASIGPFADHYEEQKVLDNLRRADLITVRETQTLNYLEEKGGFQNIKLTADPAFLLKPSLVASKKTVIGTENIIGLNISPLIPQYGGKSHKYVIDETIKFIKNSLKDNFQVLLIPHENKLKEWNNDYEFMRPIYDYCRLTGKINLIPPVYNAMQTKSIISRCRFFIGARTHSVISALSSGVPTISISYSAKSKGIHIDIYGNEDLLFNVKDFSAAVINQKMAIMQKKESDLRDLLQLKIPVMKERAISNIKYLKELMSK